MAGKASGLISRLRSYQERSGPFALTRLAAFPLVLLVTNPIRLARSVWKARILLNGRWSRYSGFRPLHAINFMFYWTLALNFDRFGRSGRSTCVSTGDFPVGKWWHISLTSIYMMWRIGSMLPILCMFAWLGSHLMWTSIEGASVAWIVLVMAVSFASSYFYGAAFVFQNYNVVGWLFMPVGLFGLVTENYWIAAASWFAASLGSVTMIAVVGMLSMGWIVVSGSLLPGLVILPAVAKFGTHFMFTKNVFESLGFLGSAIGLNGNVKSEVKYRYRRMSSRLYAVDSVYFVLSGSLLAFLCYYSGNSEVAWMVLMVVGIWILNAGIARFADQPSIYMAMFSVGTAAAIICNDWTVLGAYWLVISPLPRLIGAAGGSSNLDLPESYGPFDINQVLQPADDFLKPVPKGNRVLLSVEDPNGEYYKVYDGYRVLYEVLFHAGSRSEVLVLPDWWAVFDNNKVGDPGFWGREVSEVQGNVAEWKADYVVVYQASGSELDSEWTRSGFELVNTIDWGEVFNRAGIDDDIWPDNCDDPKWFLLKVGPQSRVEEQTESV